MNTGYDFCNLCKRLSNPERWHVLGIVAMADRDFGLIVTDISNRTRLGVSATSQYLAQLEDECGLVRSKREGRYVSYCFEAGTADARIAKLGVPLWRRFCIEGGATVSILPALANANRLKVVAALRKAGLASKAELQKATGMTEINVRRHLSIMLDAGLAVSDGLSFSI